MHEVSQGLKDARALLKKEGWVVGKLEARTVRRGRVTRRFCARGAINEVMLGDAYNEPPALRRSTHDVHRAYATLAWVIGDRSGTFPRWAIEKWNDSLDGRRGRRAVLKAFDKAIVLAEQTEAQAAADSAAQAAAIEAELTAVRDLVGVS